MSNDNFQNTSDIKLQNTSEIKLQSTAEIRMQNTGDLKGSDGYDSFSEQTSKKERIISIVICVVIAFIIWLVISNINMLASTPATLPLRADTATKVLEHSLKIWAN